MSHTTFPQRFLSDSPRMRRMNTVKGICEGGIVLWHSVQASCNSPSASNVLAEKISKRGYTCEPAIAQAQGHGDVGYLDFIVQPCWRSVSGVRPILSKRYGTFKYNSKWYFGVKAVAGRVITSDMKLEDIHQCQGRDSLNSKWKRQADYPPEFSPRFSLFKKYERHVRFMRILCRKKGPDLSDLIGSTWRLSVFRPVPLSLVTHEP
ncbi:hypothetical protein I307_02573 [Cryptococcus deuterogattii 99/473]|uniref:Unplaced genomic scaffold supercont1.10, whole genome shotgun sequence n=1 Tax=Cryptococcus deuterogattii Ram5 TaxID=1296110 RepID=A0A0D0TV63_9TREE|nr:hypothetical protein I309_03006 [Cryptococcus deuterogattii LA55]KIR39813.1 hypothetical protein I313_04286 [Cryptococcus deuterogattii Ram5]KIR70637.1 hypothetical protein I310_05486 [Cryptococcus deuterogattii CA1014]KIR90783.1 hypothetical protein I304_05434 [Cryptococcus deuterogattii CBS 10090]KIY57899.1 hypothetical protein I307_02573 [Cryptococcus deuterogattii 99/473]